MYYIRRFWVYPYNDKLKKVLESEYNIACTVFKDYETEKEKSFVFDVSDLHPKIEELNKLLPPETPYEELGKDLGSDSILVSICPNKHFAESEFLSAKWLLARNSTSKVIPANCETIDRCECFVGLNKIGIPYGRHMVQNEPYVIKSPIKWGRSAFVSAMYHEERLFCNSSIRAILTAEQITGIEFDPVYKKATMKPMEDIYQLKYTHTVPDGAIVSFVGMEGYVCDQCGMHMLRQSMEKNSFALKHDFIDESIDIWETQSMFLGEKSMPPVDGHRELIISQKFYRFLKENKFDRGFHFEPLEDRGDFSVQIV
jgi:hypothetical protein